MISKQWISWNSTKFFFLDSYLWACIRLHNFPDYKVPWLLLVKKLASWIHQETGTCWGRIYLDWVFCFAFIKCLFFFILFFLVIMFFNVVSWKNGTCIFFLTFRCLSSEEVAGNSKWFKIKVVLSINICNCLLLHCI